MRVFLDSNAWISAFATRGICAGLVKTLLVRHQQGTLTLLTCLEVVMESRRILTDKFGATASDLIPVNTVMESAEFVAGNIVSAEISDPDDRPIIAAALGGRSKLFVTGDYALLTLERIDTMELLAPRALYERLIAGSSWTGLPEPILAATS